MKKINQSTFNTKLAALEQNVLQIYCASNDLYVRNNTELCELFPERADINKFPFVRSNVQY